MIAVEALRYTPAGIPVAGLRIEHQSRQIEAGIPREVQCEMTVAALGKNAEQAARFKVGDVVRVEGFLARRSRNSTQLVLHANLIELI